MVQSFQVTGGMRFGPGSSWARQDRSQMAWSLVGHRSAVRLESPSIDRLSVVEEAIIVAFRRHILLPLDDCFYALEATIPHLTRSSLYRCLQTHGISRLAETSRQKPAQKKFKAYPIGFHIDIAEVQTAKESSISGTMLASPMIWPSQRKKILAAQKMGMACTWGRNAI